MVEKSRALLTRALFVVAAAWLSAACSDSSAEAGAGGVTAVAGGGGVTAVAGVGGVAAAGGAGSSAATGGAATHGGEGGGVSGAGAATVAGAGAGGASATAGAGGLAGSAGAASGGEGGSGGSAGADGSGGATTCALPTSFQWTSTGPLSQPKSGWVSLKDFTHVVHAGKHVVYMTTHDAGSSWGAAMYTFTDWADAATATQVALSRTAVAPTLFYFTPKQLWVLAYQWGGPAFSYATSPDPTDPTKWSSGATLFDGGPSSSTGPIDQTVICDSQKCYLFFATDDGKIHRSEMPIGDFPGTFSGYKTILSESQNALFEAVQVYSIRGASLYLMLVEAIGSGGRFFRSFIAPDLGGAWTALAATESQPFAGKANVTFEGGSAWTNDISHGDLIRADASETMPVDACRLQLLYQGRDPAASGDYGKLPYRPGLLTLAR